MYYTLDYLNIQTTDLDSPLNLRPYRKYNVESSLDALRESAPLSREVRPFTLCVRASVPLHQYG